MLTTLCVLAVVTAAPGDDSPLKLTNLRASHGILGPKRDEQHYLPGDCYILNYNIEGLKADAAGKVQYDTTVEITDDSGKVLFKGKPNEMEAVNALGTGTVPGYARMDISLTQKPGDYGFKLTVSDRTSKKSATVSRSVRVLPTAFGLIRLTNSFDAQGEAHAAALAAGQSLWISAGIVGFARNSAGQPNIRVTLRVLDENGKPTLEKPFSGEINKDIPAKALTVPAQFHLSLNRPGTFTVELEAADLVAKKEAKLTFPINVLPVK